MKNKNQTTIRLLFFITFITTALSASTSDFTELLGSIEDQWRQPFNIQRTSFINRLRNWWNPKLPERIYAEEIPSELIPEDVKKDVIAELMPEDSLYKTYLKLDDGIFDTRYRTNQEIEELLKYCDKHPNIHIKNLILVGDFVKDFTTNPLLSNIIQTFKKTTTQLTIYAFNCMFEYPDIIKLATLLVFNLINLRQIKTINMFSPYHTLKMDINDCNPYRFERIIKKYNPNITVTRILVPYYDLCKF